MLQRLGATYPDVLADHHRLVRSALRSHDGREVDNAGDGFFAMFSSTRACAAAAVEMQRELAVHVWPEGGEARVRMGIHAGEASETAIGPVGLEVHRAARIAAVAHGGQIVLSGAAAALVGDALPEGAAIKDLGLHVLKDLGRPEAIYQLTVQGLPAAFPPLRSLDNPDLKNNLPVQFSTFVGRERELHQIRDLLGQSRLVTLTGTGGCGKSRLALQLGGEVLDGSGDGVWLVELAPVLDPDLVASSVARVLSVREEPGRPVSDTLVDALRTRDLLVILDNCEHLVDACAGLVDILLRSCPGVEVVATEPRGPGHRRGTHLPGPLVVPSCGGDGGRRPRRRTPVGGGRAPGGSGAGAAARVRPRRHQCRRPWCRSADGSTASRWPSSWRPPASGPSRSPRSTPVSTTTCVS